MDYITLIFDIVYKCKKKKKKDLRRRQQNKGYKGDRVHRWCVGAPYLELFSAPKSLSLPLHIQTCYISMHVICECCLEKLTLKGRATVITSCLLPIIGPPRLIPYLSCLDTSPHPSILA